MNITLDDQTLTATVEDFDADQWATQSSTIPDSYRIKFLPPVDESVITSMGRAVDYVMSVTYVSFWNGQTFISQPMSVMTQYADPAPNPTTVTSNDSTGEATNGTT